MKCHTKQCHFNAIFAISTPRNSVQCESSQGNASEHKPDVQNNAAAQTWCGLLATTGKEGLGSWKTEKENLLSDLEEDSGQEGGMGEEGFEVRNEKTVGGTQPKPCFTWETLEHAASWRSHRHLCHLSYRHLCHLFHDFHLSHHHLCHVLFYPHLPSRITAVKHNVSPEDVLVKLLHGRLW